MTGVFITGTGTDVGKTVVATAIVKSLVAEGIDVGVMKPVETGGGDDAQKLQQAAASTDSIDLVCPYRLKHALAPMIAAELENTTLNIQKIIDCYNRLSSRHEVVVVEGAGGVAVPITQRLLISDLIAMLHIPSIVVGRAGLGTINHTVLTVEHLQHKNIRVIAIVLNGSKGDEAEIDNPRVIQQMTTIEHIYTTPQVIDPFNHSFDLEELRRIITE
ncbi:MAG: ATP-dependent dethiobiotin synthetase BioD [Candidatus Argoarchaeum ethanivorans]|uniref:ATP-dependent dethiobiotin synthetase BioD n=1 Tax=Candidatus Argoarchaeum ethanivorans TaxID=2608793 RepID=A0A811TDL4_9EURY|nr:MAG: ATP-dependent dethiobiotin synthetase BioD [Candidatus Argoarchaeum ethanivorans]